MDVVNAVIVPALGVGAIYALVGISFNLVFAPGGVFNFAQGQIVMLGGFLTLSLYENVGLALPLVVLIVVLAGAFVGVAEERIAVWPALRRDPHGQGWVLSTLAVFNIIQGIAILQWGTTPEIVGAFPGLSLTRETIAGIEFPPYYIGTFGAAVAVTVALHLFFKRTMLGRSFAATAQDREAATLRGINVRNVTILGFALGGGLACVVGLLAVPATLASVSVGLTLTFRGFIAAAIGGMGVQAGALVGGLLLGLIEMGTQHYWSGGYTNFVMVAALLLLLLIRPNGIFGERVPRRI